MVCGTFKKKKSQKTYKTSSNNTAVSAYTVYQEKGTLFFINTHMVNDLMTSFRVVSSLLVTQLMMMKNILLFTVIARKTNEEITPT